MPESEATTIYDIFSGILDHDALWIVAVSGLRTAIDVMNRISDKHPGSYFVFDTMRRSVVAQVSVKLHLVA
ncbi:MAG TPA: hypothetical protein VN517_09805 [Terriglobales bacterium]|nr:hypothetical protein [Terriglobales bacterium]